MNPLDLHWRGYFENPNVDNGEAFENEVADWFFPDDLYELIHRSHSYEMNRERFIRSTLWPDFQFEIRETGQQFWVECKWRANRSDSDLIDIFKDGQVERYLDHDPYFLMLCTHFSGEPRYYFMPMHEVQYNSLYLSRLRPYEVTMEPPIWPGLIEKYC